MSRKQDRDSQKLFFKSEFSLLEKILFTKPIYWFSLTEGSTMRHYLDNAQKYFSFLDKYKHETKDRSLLSI